MARCADRAGAMRLEPLAQRAGLRLFGAAQVRFDAGRRNRCRRAEQVFEHPLAARYRRRAGGHRRHREHAALTEEPAARAVRRQLDAPEVAAVYVSDAVVTCEPLVDEGVVGVEQIDQASILANDGAEEQLGLAAERLTQV